MPAVKSGWKKLGSLAKKDGLRQHEEEKYTTLRAPVQITLCIGFE